MSEQFALDATVAALRAAVAGSRSAIPTVSADTLPAVLLLARQNKVLSMVRKHIAGTEALQPALTETAATMAANTALLQELHALVPRLRASGLQFLVIKGPVQQKLIHGTFFQRPAADLDILVRADDFLHAKRLLTEHGYSLATPSVWWRSVLGEEHFRKRAVPHLAIDLHHRVHQPGAPAPYDATRLFSDIETVSFDGIEIPTLNALNAMLLCTISIAKALYNREPSAAYLCDLYIWLMAATPSTVNSFLSISTTSGLGGHTRLSMTLMEALLGVPPALTAHAGEALARVPEPDLHRMILAPRHPATRWPRRRDLLWELCERRPARYGREFARVLGSELTRRLFERGAVA